MPRPKSYHALPEYYDAEYEGAESLQRDVPFLLEHLPRRSQLILELGTGTGRAAIPLAQAGHRVTGVDYDAGMLKLARFKRDSVGLGDQHLALVRQDLLKLQIDATFDWAVILFNTLLLFTTLEQQDRVLQNVRKHLKPRGRLWIDIFNPNLELLAQEHVTNLDPANFYVPSLDRSVHRDTEVRASSDGAVQHVTFHYRWHDESGEARHERSTFDMTAIFPRELKVLLERNGYVVETMDGDYDGSVVQRNSPRIIACARIV